jgi:hypothetical protein
VHVRKLVAHRFRPATWHGMPCRVQPQCNCTMPARHINSARSPTRSKPQDTGLTTCLVQQLAAAGTKAPAHLTLGCQSRPLGFRPYGLQPAQPGIPQCMSPCLPSVSKLITILYNPHAKCGSHQDRVMVPQFCTPGPPVTVTTPHPSVTRLLCLGWELTVQPHLAFLRHSAANPALVPGV